MLTLDLITLLIIIKIKKTIYNTIRKLSDILFKALLSRIIYNIRIYLNF